MAIRLDRATGPLLLQRLEPLADGAQPAWGAMSAPVMVGHLSQSLCISTGAVAAENVSRWFFRAVARRMVLWGLMPMPKGRINSGTVFQDPSAGTVAEARETFASELAAFLDALEADPARVTTHPQFGPMPLAKWSRLHWVHFAHHFKQFGL